MRDIDATYLLDVKEKAQTAKLIIDATLIGLAVLSGIYFVYWVAVMTDPMIYDLGKWLFEPFAKFLTPTDTSMYIFRTASFKLFGLIIPTLLLYYMVDKYEQRAHEKYNAQLEEQQKQMLLYAKFQKMHKYDAIKEYSICLSLDYSDNSKKESLNGMVFAEVKDTMSKKIPYVNVNIVSSDTMVMRSKEFDKYDYTYDVLLKVLACAKKMLSMNYNIEMTPSITTDAFMAGKHNKDIEQHHFEIQSFNLKNKALCTAEFSKKYQNMKFNKYAGVPIGEYAYFDKQEENTYELNVVNKNLVNTLEKMIS